VADEKTTEKGTIKKILVLSGGGEDDGKVSTGVKSWRKKRIGQEGGFTRTRGETRSKGKKKDQKRARQHEKEAKGTVLSKDKRVG